MFDFSPDIIYQYSVTLADFDIRLFSLSLHHSVIETKGRAMEVVTHLVNDTVEFYKWSLTIAGKLGSLAWKQHAIGAFTTYAHLWGGNMVCSTVAA